MVRTTLKLVVIAGTLLPAIGASGGRAWAQLPVPPTIELPTSTTTSTTSTSTTTTTTTEVPAATTTTTSVAASPDAPAPDGPSEVSTPDGTTLEDAPADATTDGASGTGLSISVPAAAELSAGTPVGSARLSGQLGPVTVVDGRSGLVPGWTAQVTASDFVTGGATAAETIGRANVAYWSGPATATSGLASFTPGQAAPLLAAPLLGPVVAFGAVATTGGTSATWTPTLVVTIPPSAVVGQYHGTITHSVA
jgi:hypothetical protein